MLNRVEKMLEFVFNSPTSYQAVDSIKKELNEEGFKELIESDSWQIEKGGKYYVVRNHSSIIAFKIGNKLEHPSFHVMASHSDAPSFKIKPRSKNDNAGYEIINTEVYGGPIYNTWMDRLLSIAGRLIIRDKDEIIIKPICLNYPVCLIPNLAIHMNRMVNDGVKLNPQVDLMPMCSKDKDFDMMKLIAKEYEINVEDIIDTDLFLYPYEKGRVWGSDNEFVSAYHLDDLQCAYTTLQGFKQGENSDTISMYCCFDNEEVGSGTKQGADSTFLMDILARIQSGLKMSDDELKQALASSMIVSADNAHAVHPNHPEKSDPTNKVEMNEGIVIKYNANQSYTTDGISASLFKEICRQSGLSWQTYTNRSDERGGGTLGAISIAHVSILSVDIGCAQLAMHSALETAGSKDVDTMIEASKSFYDSHIVRTGQNSYRVWKV
ncbi:M18 family aminopeptidase [Anaerorhabdus sp.]|uniref:M18 family aminopeptidase n=1 Tax=Anaerorhabdus sp. TaxID=1872524 RepID=UPI002B1EEBB8|nr:M18 family aminopeptidase [Anaerorhabdus sp.]MEA4874597.1 M18 family aminopeptidase [Anaerorhabdus sp.]